MIEYLGIVIFMILAGAVAAVFVLLASTLGTKRPSAVKSEPFECGEIPFSLPVGRPVGQVLPHRDSLHRLRCRDRLPLPMGRGVPRARWARPCREHHLSGSPYGRIRLRLGQRGPQVAVGLAARFWRRISNHAPGRGDWLGPQVFDFSISVCDCLLWHGVHGDSLLPL